MGLITCTLATTIGNGIMVTKNVYATENRHWAGYNNEYYEYNNGLRAKGWAKIDGKWYYLNESNGYKVKNSFAIEIDKNYYYLDSDGVMQTGWKIYNGGTYHFADNGAMDIG